MGGPLDSYMKNYSIHSNFILYYCPTDKSVVETGHISHPATAEGEESGIFQFSDLLE